MHQNHHIPQQPVGMEGCLFIKVYVAGVAAVDVPLPVGLEAGVDIKLISAGIRLLVGVAKLESVGH